MNIAGKNGMFIPLYLFDIVYYFCDVQIIKI